MITAVSSLLALHLSISARCSFTRPPSGYRPSQPFGSTRHAAESRETATAARRLMLEVQIWIEPKTRRSE